MTRPREADPRDEVSQMFEVEALSPSSSGGRRAGGVLAVVLLGLLGGGAYLLLQGKQLLGTPPGPGRDGALASATPGASGPGVGGAQRAPDGVAQGGGDRAATKEAGVDAARTGGAADAGAMNDNGEAKKHAEADEPNEPNEPKEDTRTTDPYAHVRRTVSALDAEAGQGGAARGTDPGPPSTAGAAGPPSSDEEVETDEALAARRRSRIQYLRMSLEGRGEEVRQ